MGRYHSDRSKKFLAVIIFIFLLFPLNLYTQVVQKDWDRTYGGNRFDYSAVIKKFNNGDFILVGSSKSDSSGEKSQNLYAGPVFPVYWTVRIKSNGDLIRDNSYSGLHGDQIYGIYLNPDDTYYLLGISRNWNNENIGGDRTDFNRGSSDIWVLKIDKNGNKIWDKALGGTGDDSAYSIIKVDDGFILTGVSTSNIGYEKSENNRGVGYSDIWVIKIDFDGNKIWDRTYGGNKTEYFDYPGYYNSLILPDGSIYIVANSFSDISGDRTALHKGGSDFWLIKLDSNGNKLWDKSYGGSGDDYVSSIVRSQDGNLLLSGYTNTGVDGDKTQVSNGKNDFWLVKIDLDGNIIWDKSYGGSDDDCSMAVITCQMGGYLIGGYSKSGINGDKSEDNLGVYDFWIVKINEDGDLEWDKTFGGSGNDQLYSIVELSDREYALVGVSKSNVGNDKSENSRGDYDFWLLKTKPGDPFALEDLKLQTATYRDKIKLTWKDSRPQGSEVRYAILHSSGKEIKSSNWDTLGYTGQKEYNHLHPEYGTHRYRICRMEEFGGCSVSNIQSVTYENHLERIIITTNRAQEAINIEYQLPDERGSVSVYNGQGSLIHEQRLSHKGLLHIETINWPSGVYYFQFVGIYGVLESRKVVVEK